MLDVIRNNTQSLGVKVAFGIIILVFVFWGLGSVQNINNSTTLITVDDEAISVIDFERAYQQSVESVRAQNPKITPEEIKGLLLPQQVIQQLIVQSLLKAEVKRLHLSVSANDLRKTILAIPAFHNKDGKFDKNLYKNIVESRFLGASQFEEELSEDIAQNKLRHDITRTAQGFASETAAFFGYTYEERDVEYMFFPSKDILPSVESPSLDDMKKFYDTNKITYSLPAKGDVEYIAVYPKDLTVQAVGEHKEKSETEEQSEDVFIKLREVLDALIEANVLGKNLQEIAKVHGLKVQNTNLQTVSELAKTLLVAEEQAKKLLAIDSGVPLDVALETTDGGYIVARMGKKVVSSVRPFEEVQDEISLELKRQVAHEKAFVKANEELKVIEGKSLEANSLKSITKVMRGQSIGDLGNNSTLGLAIFNTPIDTWLPNAYKVSINGEDGAVIVRVKRIGTSTDETWKPMEGILANALTNQRQEKMFQLLLAKLQENAKINIVNEAYLNALTK